MTVFIRLLKEYDERIDCASEFWGISEGNVVDREGLKEVGKGIGESPKGGRSGGCGEGTKIVFRTSRRPRLADGLRGVATCCACCIQMSGYKTGLHLWRGLTARNALATLENAD